MDLQKIKLWTVRIALVMAMVLIVWFTMFSIWMTPGFYFRQTVEQLRPDPKASFINVFYGDETTFFFEQDDKLLLVDKEGKVFKQMVKPKKQVDGASYGYFKGQLIWVVKTQSKETWLGQDQSVILEWKKE